MEGRKEGRKGEGVGVEKEQSRAERSRAHTTESTEQLPPAGYLLAYLPSYAPTYSNYLPTDLCYASLLPHTSFLAFHHTPPFPSFPMPCHT